MRFAEKTVADNSELVLKNPNLGKDVNHSDNYFELFGLEPGFELDQAKLLSQYRNLQKELHPDRFVQADDHQKLVAVQNTALVNEAFQTLKIPTSRAEYLLLQSGVEIPRDTTISDPMFLLSQMELRETMADISDHADPEESLEKLRTEVDQLSDGIKQAFVQHWTKGCEAELKQAVLCVQKLKFYDKLSAELNHLEEQLLD